MQTFKSFTGEKPGDANSDNVICGGSTVEADAQLGDDKYCLSENHSAVEKRRCALCSHSVFITPRSCCIDRKKKNENKDK